MGARNHRFAFGAPVLYEPVPAFGTFVDSNDIFKLIGALLIAVAAVWISYTD